MEEKNGSPNTLTYNKLISECDSLCDVDDEAYCIQEMTIVVDEKEVNGTCRSFAKKGNVEGFNRCQEFCKKYGKIE